MTGWRLGYAHGPSRLIQEMAKLQQFSYVCAPSVVQKAGVVALDQDLSPRGSTPTGRSATPWSRHLGGLYDLPHPGGAFYAFPRAPWGTASEFVAEAIRRSLLIIPGNVFSRRDTHFRISYAVDDATLGRGLSSPERPRPRPPLTHPFSPPRPEPGAWPRTPHAPGVASPRSRAAIKPIQVLGEQGQRVQPEPREEARAIHAIVRPRRDLSRAGRRRRANQRTSWGSTPMKRYSGTPARS